MALTPLVSPDTAAGTGLDACLPPWTEDGGYPALFKRLRDPATREKIKAEVQVNSDKWENLYLAAGSPEKILLVGFKSEKLKPLTGKTLAEVAKMRGKDPIDTAMDLIAEDESRISTVYYLMSEENVKKEVTKPWISFGSDEASQAPEGCRKTTTGARGCSRTEAVLALPDLGRLLSVPRCRLL